MTSEVSRFDIERLGTSPANLEKRVERLVEALRATDARHFDRACEVEPRLMKWGTILFGMSIAFSLFIAFCAKHPAPARTETAVEAAAKTN